MSWMNSGPLTYRVKHEKVSNNPTTTTGDILRLMQKPRVRLYTDYYYHYRALYAIRRLINCRARVPKGTRAHERTTLHTPALSPSKGLP